MTPGRNCPAGYVLASYADQLQAEINRLRALPRQLESLLDRHGAITIEKCTSYKDGPPEYFVTQHSGPVFGPSLNLSTYAPLSGAIAEAANASKPNTKTEGRT